MTRFAVVLALGCVISLAAVGCSDDDSSSSASSNTSTSTTSTTQATTSTTSLASSLAEGDAYVALGSSIASGFGIAEQSTDCGRSSRSYAQIIAKQYDLELTDVSCGTAPIPNVVDSPQGTNPPQITALDENTKLITISVGGNDIGYNGTTVGCGDPATVCTAPPSLDADVTTTRSALDAMLEKIKAASPSAIIVFVTYPREVPEGNCPALSFTDAEAATVRDMGTKLEALFVDFAKTAEDMVFVDPYVEPGDHTGCAPESERWTAGHEVTDGFAYHPTALGHQVMAKMIADALGSR